MSILDDRGIPIGLGMALAENPEAFRYFSSLDSKEQEKVIRQSYQMRSREEMHRMVSSLGQIKS
ncbi:MAG: hypothetical protein ACI4EG_09950 [Fusicatenibacter sp.]|nr:hypothetical protein [Fusicatenibacter sp.]